MEEEVLILQLIDKRRQDLFKVAYEHGLTSPETLKISNRLDWLINLYYKIQSMDLKRIMAD